MKTTVGFIFLLAFVIFSCEKDTETDSLPDYRDKYVGEYTFYVSHHYLKGFNGYDPNYADNNYTYDGSIAKSPYHPDKIKVCWGEETLKKISFFLVGRQNSELTVDEEGNLDFPELKSDDEIYFDHTSKIHSDTIDLGYSMGNHFPTYWKVKGIKKQNQDK